MPGGPLRITGGFAWRFVQHPTVNATHIFQLQEANAHTYRQIFMDGRKHPEDPSPTWYGHSSACADAKGPFSRSIPPFARYTCPFARHQGLCSAHSLRMQRHRRHVHVDPSIRSIDLSRCTMSASVTVPKLPFAVIMRPFA
jgi:hypothetical protein